MKSSKNILVAFLLNLSFSIIEFVGGLFTKSVAIMSDSFHDFGDCLSIFLAYVLEKKSQKNPDDIYTYGYLRFSVLGSIITTFILISGSILVIYNAIKRIFKPVSLNYQGILVLAVVGVIVNLLAALATREKDTLNQKSINLHMLEDVLGWIVVLIGGIVMLFTHISWLDSVLSILVALYILKEALENLKIILDIFLERIPDNVNLEEVKKNILELKGVKGIHHIHIRSIDGVHNYATMHVIVEDISPKIKADIKRKLKTVAIDHSTIELEKENEKCCDEKCNY